MLAEWWPRGETFIVLEQDKIPVRGALQELWQCGHLWCTFPVAMRGGGPDIAPYPSLACTKFDRELMERAPDLMQNVGTLDLGFGEREWSRLDLAIAGLLEPLCAPHWHARGRVMHLH
jgi:hypothetical protein